MTTPTLTVATDPLTAVLLLVTRIVENYGKVLDKMTPDQSAQFAQMFLDDLKQWRDFCVTVGLSRPLKVD